MNEDYFDKLAEYGLTDYKDFLVAEGWDSLDSLVDAHNNGRLSEDSIGDKMLKKPREKLILGLKKLSKDHEQRKKKHSKKLLETIEGCNKRLDSIQLIYRTKVDKLADVKDFYATTSLVAEVLERLSESLYTPLNGNFITISDTGNGESSEPSKKHQNNSITVTPATTTTTTTTTTVTTTITVTTSYTSSSPIPVSSPRGNRSNSLAPPGNSLSSSSSSASSASSSGSSSPLSLSSPNSDLYSHLRGLLTNLEEYSSYLVGLAKQKKLIKHLNTPHRRVKVATFDAQIYNDIKFILEESTTGTSPRRNSLSLIVQPEGKTFWTQQFKAEINLLVPWPLFLKGFQTATQIGDKLTLEDEILLSHVLDQGGYVTPGKFSDFLCIFGPIDKCLANMKELYSQKWFTPYMSVEEVYRHLSTQPPGTFLVRFSLSKQNSLALEYVEADNKIRTVMIQCNYMSGVQVTESDQQIRKFDSLKQLIAHYSDVLVRPYSAEFLGKKWFYGDVDVDEADELLRNCPAGTFLIHFHGRNFKVSGILVCSYTLKNSKVQHMYLRKVKAGYTQQNRPTSDVYKSTDFVFTKSRGQSISSPEIKPTRTLSVSSARDSYNGKVYPTLNDFIEAHRQILRYNYDTDGVPHLLFCPYDSTVSFASYSSSSSTSSSSSSSSGNSSSMSAASPNNSSLFGPTELDKGIKLSFGDHVACQTVSTYPRDTIGSQVLCDAFKVEITGNRTLFVLADGCNWGTRSRDAAQKAAHSFISTLSAVKENLNDTTEAKHFLLRAFSKAHDSIIEGHEDIFAAGTTALIGGMLVELVDFPGHFAFLCASVGDCKAFHYDKLNQTVTDVTFGNRRNARDPRDCGGRIGPYMEGGGPDLRNLRCYFYPCKPGDLLLVVTDGIHDNFDPEPLGNSLGDLVTGNTWKTWSEVPNKELEKIKSKFQCDRISKRIMKLSDKSALSVTSDLIDYCTVLTEKSRSYLEKNPNKPEPTDFVEYPGKMDHTTCISINVREYSPTENSYSENGLKKSKKDKKPLSSPTSTRDNTLSSSSGSSGVVRSVSDPVKKRPEIIRPISPSAINRNEDSWFFIPPVLEAIELIPKLDIQYDLYSNYSFSDSLSSSGTITGDTLSILKSDDSEKISVFGTSGAAWSLSTFPKHFSLNSHNYCLHISKTGVFIALSQGYSNNENDDTNTENLPNIKDAAAKLVNSWMRHVTEYFCYCAHINQVAKEVVKGCVEAHKSILETNFSGTFLCGVSCQLSGLEDTSEGGFCFVGFSVGKHKFFRWNSVTEQLSEIDKIKDEKEEIPKKKEKMSKKKQKQQEEDEEEGQEDRKLSESKPKKKKPKRKRKEDEDGDNNSNNNGNNNGNNNNGNNNSNGNNDNKDETGFGRIGPIKKTGKPDLSDVKILYTRCHENDVIIAMSPKAWQIFDPKNPSDAGLEESSWKDVTNRIAVRKKYRRQHIQKLIKNLEQKSAVLVTKAIIHQCVKSTEKMRDFVADKSGNLSEILSEATAKFPGTLGQVTVLGFEVKRMEARDSVDGVTRGLHMHTAFKPMPKVRKIVQE